MSAATLYMHIRIMRSLLFYLLLLASLPSTAQRYEVLIHEIFADPTPSIGLPNSEWIEIRNRSVRPIPLQGWRIGDNNGQSAPFPYIVLGPDSLLILCATNAVNTLSIHGKCLGLAGFPSLDNEGEIIVLRNAQGKIIHAIEYANEWHQTELKKEGGWSLEMIDTNHPGLFQKNWRSSIHPSGGTPGKPNSIASPLEDRDPPGLFHLYAPDSLHLRIRFDEALDSSVVSQEGFFHLSDGIEIIEARCLPPLFDRIELRTDRALQHEKIYTLTVTELSDLMGNHLNGTMTARTGVPSTPLSSDIRINEILFDPPTGGADYIELVNISKKIIDLSRLHFSSRATNGTLGSIKRLMTEPTYFFPGDHLVCTSDPPALERNYFVQNPNQVISTDALPSLPDTEGSLVVLNEQGETMDELRYSGDWHFSALQTRMGIALERIDPAGKTQDRNNWQSAASTVGYGTPTRRNSQYRLFHRTRSLELSSEVISPDNDGQADFIQIKYKTDTPADRIRIRIFHTGGKMIRELANLALAGNESVFTWDGLDDQRNQLSTGQYILLVETTDVFGKTDRMKKVIALINRSP